MELSNLNDTYKNIFCILVAEKAGEYLKASKEHARISEVLDRCWEWVREEFPIADELCEVLASEEEEDFANASAMETNPQKVSAWGCVIYALAYIAKSAFQAEGDEYVPEYLEMDADEMLDNLAGHFMECALNNGPVLKDIYDKCMQKVDISVLHRF